MSRKRKYRIWVAWNYYEGSHLARMDGWYVTGPWEDWHTTRAGHIADEWDTPDEPTRKIERFNAATYELEHGEYSPPSLELRKRVGSCWRQVDPSGRVRAGTSQGGTME